ncbi:hypothetical protein PoB_004715800 [Plakobranchus ocellatus]|uniref:Uncharacterized protein n=1 Tax=Plakobranchus ocellatus TaxID=259542 RepID=A0AAV4BPC7_9GAST|nr:hypothetical protein PoB_004715800 [Plakobranchus ocellatus]
MVTRFGSLYRFLFQDHRTECQFSERNRSNPYIGSPFRTIAQNVGCQDQSCSKPYIGFLSRTIAQNVSCQTETVRIVLSVSFSGPSHRMSVVKTSRVRFLVSIPFSKPLYRISSVKTSRVRIFVSVPFPRPSLRMSIVSRPDRSNPYIESPFRTIAQNVGCQDQSCSNPYIGSLFSTIDRMSVVKTGPFESLYRFPFQDHRTECRLPRPDRSNPYIGYPFRTIAQNVSCQDQHALKTEDKKKRTTGKDKQIESP